MKNFKFNYILIILFFLLFGIILRQFFGLLSFANSALNFEGESQQEKFSPNYPIIQKITATENNLNQINVSLGKFSPILGEKIILEVADESCESVLAQTQLNFFSWHSPSYDKFHFPAIANSQGKTYCLKFTHIPGFIKPDKKPYINSYPAENSSLINTSKSSEEQKNRSLALKPAYSQGSAGQNLSLLINRLSQYKPDYFKSGFLIAIFISSLILIFSIAVFITFL